MKRRSSSSGRAGPPKGSLPNPAPFPYADYVRARQTLLKSLKSGPHFYALLSGLSGMGKTSLLRDIQDELERHRYQIVYISSSNASAVGIVRLFVQRLHVSPRLSYLETVQVLSEAIRAQPAQVLLWIDEADQADRSTLQEVRMLVESDLGSEPLATVVLSGLPALLALVDAPALFPLKRRISLRCSLCGLVRDELDLFLEHRFGATDAQRVPASVRDELFERTQATPALIDQVIRHALAVHSGRLDAEDVRATLDSHGL